MDQDMQQQDDQPVWCVGHYLEDPDLELTDAVAEGEFQCGVSVHPRSSGWIALLMKNLQYDLLTARISNSEFESRVETTVAQAAAESRTRLHLDSLTLAEANIHPGNCINSSIALASPWIEVDSENPLFAHVSKQALDIELAYAAFCGIQQVIVPGPKSTADVGGYALAINQALSHSPYMQILIQLPVSDSNEDPFAVWDAWNTIRTVCKYHNLLGVGKNVSSPAVSRQLTLT